MVKIKTFNICKSNLIFQVTPSVWHKSIPLYNFLAGGELIKSCGILDIGIIGIEGFIVIDDNIFPQMDLIADFSVLLLNKDFKKNSLKAAEKFIKLAEDRLDILFEFALIE